VNLLQSMNNNPTFISNSLRANDAAHKNN
jgi:hypothetical protein